MINFCQRGLVNGLEKEKPPRAKSFCYLLRKSEQKPGRVANKRCSHD